MAAHLLGRGPANRYSFSCGHHNACDVSALSRRGKNAFAAINAVGINARLAFSLQARLDLPDGSFTIIGTDKS